MKFKENILPPIICGVTIAIVIGVGYLVLDRVGKEYWIAVGFCIDKEGIYNITNYGYELIVYDELNCSNKENPIGIDTAIATVSWPH